MGIVYLNGRYLEEGNAHISITDRGFLYGEGIFDTMFSSDGTVFRLDEHLTRMWSSATELKLTIPVTKGEVREILSELLEKNGLSNAYLRITLTGGSASGMTPDEKGSPVMLIVAKPLQPYPAEMYEQGITVVITPYYLGPLASHKMLSFLPNIAAREFAKNNSAVEGLLSDRAGNPAECSASNIFMVTDSGAATPPLDSGILPGITRSEVIDICRKKAIPVEERVITKDELLAAAEVFLTNSLMGIMPVSAIDDTPFTPNGPLTRLIAEHYIHLI